MTTEIFQHQAPHTKALKTKFQIGSINAPLHYNFNEQVFHINDIPLENLQAKWDIQESLKSTILINEKPRWSLTTKTGEMVDHKRNYVNSTLNRSNMYVYNYRAEVLPNCYPLMKPRANKFNTGILEVQLSMESLGKAFGCPRIEKGISRQLEELPNHPSLVGKTQWNISSDYASPINKKLLIEREAKRVENSKKKSAGIQGYINPKQQYNMKKKEKREEKATRLGKLLAPPKITN